MGFEMKRLLFSVFFAMIFFITALILDRSEDPNKSKPYWFGFGMGLMAVMENMIRLQMIEL